MGSFKIKDLEGYRQYTVFSKKAFKDILGLGKQLKKFSFNYEKKQKSERVYYDTGANVLASAGIRISKIVKAADAKIKIEKDEPKEKIAKAKNVKVYVHKINAKDKIMDHSFFIIEGITQMFSTNFTIDFDHVLKVAIPKIKINISQDIYRIFGGMGFKGEMIFEKVNYHNLETKRKAEAYMLVIKNISGDRFLKDYLEFVAEMEKHVKELIRSEDEKYVIATRMTKAIAKEST